MLVDYTDVFDVESGGVDHVVEEVCFVVREGVGCGGGGGWRVWGASGCVEGTGVH